MTLCMNTEKMTAKEDWEELISYLPEGYEKLAKEMKQLEVQYGNAKITTADELLRSCVIN